MYIYVYIYIYIFLICLDFSHFSFFLLLFPCWVFFLYLFIYLFIESMCHVAQFLVKQTIVMAQWYNCHSICCVQITFLVLEMLFKQLINCYLLEAQLTANHLQLQPQVELSHRRIHPHTNGFEPRTFFLLKVPENTVETSPLAFGS